MKHTVGLRTLQLHDETRRNWDNTGPRPLLTDVWYPAAPDAQETDTLIGSTEEPLFRSGRAARQAEPADGSFPLVVISHGSGGSALQLGWLAAPLARAGYIVAGPNHHGNTALEPYTPEGFLFWWERTADLSALIDHLVRDRLFCGHIDPARIGAAGFSLGAYNVLALAGAVIDLTALQEAYRDSKRDLLRDIPADFPNRPRLVALADHLLEHDTGHKRSYLDRRVGAAFTIAPPLAEAFRAEGLAPIEVPVKIVVGDADKLTPSEAHACRFARLIRRADLTILDGGVAHYTFLGEGTDAGKKAHPDLCLDLPGVDRTAVHLRVSAMAVEFFDRCFTVESRPQTSTT